MRRAANIDRTHEDLCNAIRGRGASVLSLASLGKGVPDILVGAYGSNYLLEIKSFPEHTVKGQLNEEQARFHSDWRGQIAVVRSFEDIGRLFPHLMARYDT